MEKHQDQLLFKIFIWYWTLVYAIEFACFSLVLYSTRTSLISAASESVSWHQIVFLAICTMIIMLSIPVAIWKMLSVYRKREWEKIRWSFAIPVGAILLVLASFEIVPRLLSRMK
jgi:hypothetical protein